MTVTGNSYWMVRDSESKKRKTESGRGGREGERERERGGHFSLPLFRHFRSAMFHCEATSSLESPPVASPTPSPVL